MTNIKLSPRETKYICTLIKGDMESLTELPAYEKLEKCYKDEYAEARQLAERLGAKLGRFPKRLTATRKEAAERYARDQAHIAELIRSHETGLPFPQPRVKH